MNTFILFEVWAFMSTIGSPVFWIPIVISLFSTGTALYEMRERRKEEEKTRELMLEILNKLTKRINRVGTKAKAKNNLSPQELDLKKQQLALQEKKFNHQKVKDFGKLIRYILDNPDEDF